MYASMNLTLASFDSEPPFLGDVSRFPSFWPNWRYPALRDR